MKPFDRLTHLGQGRRLRPHVTDLLQEHYGLRAVRLQQVAETVNIVYRVTENEQRFVLRITPPEHFHDRQDVESELAWIAALRERRLPVPVVVPAADGSEILSETWSGIPGAWHCVLFCWIPGTDLESRWNAANIVRYGQLSAQLHAAGRCFAPPREFRIRPADTVFPHCNLGFARPEPFILFDELPDDLLPPQRKSLFLRAYELAQKEIDRLFESGVPQPIHNDLHPWNLRMNRSGLYAIDFENLLMGFPVQDVGTTLNYFRDYFKDDVPFVDRLASFRKGYETIRPWPEEFAGQVRLMTMSHRLLLCNFYASHRDPEFRRFAYRFFEVTEKRIREELSECETPLD